MNSMNRGNSQDTSIGEIFNNEYSTPARILGYTLDIRWAYSGDERTYLVI